MRGGEREQGVRELSAMGFEAATTATDPPPRCGARSPRLGPLWPLASQFLPTKLSVRQPSDRFS